MFCYCTMFAWNFWWSYCQFLRFTDTRSVNKISFGFRVSHANDTSRAFRGFIQQRNSSCDYLLQLTHPSKMVQWPGLRNTPIGDSDLHFHHVLFIFPKPYVSDFHAFSKDRIIATIGQHFKDLVSLFPSFAILGIALQSLGNTFLKPFVNFFFFFDNPKQHLCISSLRAFKIYEKSYFP